MNYKIISIIIAVVFTLNSIGYAGSISSPQTAVHSPQIYISEQYGRIEKGDSPLKKRGTVPLVILIKDAHCNYEAQRNIEKILETLIRDYKIDLICVEGASGLINTKPYQSYPDQKIKENVTDRYIKKGILSASEILSICKGDKLPFTIWGVENTKLYLKNLYSFRKNYRENEHKLELVSRLSRVTEFLKEKLYHEELKDFDNKVRQYNNNDIPLGQFCLYLKNRFGIAKSYDLKLVVKSIRIEDAIDFKKVESERKVIIKNLENSLSKEELSELVKNSLLYKLGKLSGVKYYTFLGNFMKNPENYPNLTQYIRLTRLQDRINSEGLFEELDILQDKIYTGLIQNKVQEDLHKIDYNLQILLKFFKLILTRKDLDYYKYHREEFDLRNIANFLKIQAGIQNISFPDIPFDIDMKSPLTAETFYKQSMERDRILTRNLIKKMRIEKKDSAVIVAGGFHSEGIQKLLERENINCIVISPKITKTQGDNPYLSLILDEKLDIEKYIKDKKAENIPIPLVLGDLETKLSQEAQRSLAVALIRSEKLSPGQLYALKGLCAIAGISTTRAGKEKSAEELRMELKEFLNPDKIAERITNGPINEVLASFLLELLIAQLDNADEEEKDKFINALIKVSRNSKTPPIVEKAKGIIGRLQGITCSTAHMELMQIPYRMREEHHAEELSFDLKQIVWLMKIVEQVVSGMKDGETFSLNIKGVETEFTVVLDEKGRKFCVQTNIIKIIGADVFRTILANAINQEDLKNLPLDKPFIIASLRRSPRLFEDHVKNGFIGINEAFLKLWQEVKPEEKKYLDVLLQLGLEHELIHELSCAGSEIEDEQRNRDIRRIHEVLSEEGGVISFLNFLVRHTIRDRNQIITPGMKEESRMIEIQPNCTYTVPFSEIWPFIIKMGGLKLLFNRDDDGNYYLGYFPNVPDGEPLIHIFKEEGEFLLGRNGKSVKAFPELAKILQDKTVSMKHLMIIIKGDKIILKDVGSTNGTSISFLPIPQIPDSVPRSIREATLEEIKGKEAIYAMRIIQNLIQPELQKYYNGALEKNVSLVICREFQTASSDKKRQLLEYLDILLKCIEEIPSGILSKAKTPLVLKIGRIKEAYINGQARIDDTIGGAELGMTQFVNGYTGPLSNPLLTSNLDPDEGFDKVKIKGTLIHEIIGHKLATVWDRNGHMIMPPQDWVDIARANGIDGVIILDERMKKDIERGDAIIFKKTPLEKLLEMGENKFMESIRNIFDPPGLYHEALHEVIAYSLTNVNLRGKGNEKHNLNEARRILRRNFLRTEPIDSKNGICHGWEFNGRKWIEYSMQINAAGEVHPGEWKRITEYIRILFKQMYMALIKPFGRWKKIIEWIGTLIKRLKLSSLKRKFRKERTAEVRTQSYALIPPVEEIESAIKELRFTKDDIEAMVYFLESNLDYAQIIIFGRDKTGRELFSKLANKLSLKIQPKDEEYVYEQFCMILNDILTEIIYSTTQKAPGPTWSDEDREIFRAYCRSILADIPETEGLDIDEAIETANKRKPEQQIDKNRIAIHLVPSSKIPGLGIPKHEGATGAMDMVYVVGVNDDKLHIYTTQRYWNEKLSRNSLLLAESLDHEWHENILGWTHREAAGRARLFVKEGEKLSEYHLFAIAQIVADGEKGLEFLSKILKESREEPEDIDVREYEKRFKEIISSEIADRIIENISDEEFYAPLVPELGVTSEDLWDHMRTVIRNMELSRRNWYWNNLTFNSKVTVARRLVRAIDIAQEIKYKYFSNLREGSSIICHGSMLWGEKDNPSDMDIFVAHNGEIDKEEVLDHINISGLQTYIMAKDNGWIRHLKPTDKRDTDVVYLNADEIRESYGSGIVVLGKDYESSSGPFVFNVINIKRLELHSIEPYLSRLKEVSVKTSEAKYIKTYNRKLMRRFIESCFIYVKALEQLAKIYSNERIENEFSKLLSVAQEVIRIYNLNIDNSTKEMYCEIAKIIGISDASLDTLNINLWEKAYSLSNKMVTTLYHFASEMPYIIFPPDSNDLSMIQNILKLILENPEFEKLKSSMEKFLIDIHGPHFSFSSIRDVMVDYYQAHNDKQRYKVSFITKEDEISLTIGLKFTPKGFEKNELLFQEQLSASGNVPKSGLRINMYGYDLYLEEFVSGPTAGEERHDGNLNQEGKVKIICAIMNIYKLLKGKMPISISAGNFVFDIIHDRVVCVNLNKVKSRHPSSVLVSILNEYGPLPKYFYTPEGDRTRNRYSEPDYEEADYDYVFNAIISILGEEDGIAFLKKASTPFWKMDKTVRTKIKKFIDNKSNKKFSDTADEIKKILKDKYNIKIEKDELINAIKEGMYKKNKVDLLKIVEEISSKIEPKIVFEIAVDISKPLSNLLGDEAIEKGKNIVGQILKEMADLLAEAVPRDEAVQQYIRGGIEYIPEKEKRRLGFTPEEIRIITEIINEAERSGGANTVINALKGILEIGTENGLRNRGLNRGDKEVSPAPSAEKIPHNGPVLMVVENSSQLKISDSPEIKHVWDTVVNEHLRLFRFARRLTYFTHKYGFLYDFPQGILQELISFSELKAEGDRLGYILGVIMENCWIRYGSRENDIVKIKFNIIFLVSMVQSNIGIDLFLNQKNRKQIESLADEILRCCKYLLRSYPPGYMNERMRDWDGDITRFDHMRKREFPNCKSIISKLEGIENQKLTSIVEALIFDIFNRNVISFPAIAESFYSHRVKLEPRISIVRECLNNFPEEFFRHPRKYIESGEIVKQEVFRDDGNLTIGNSIPPVYMGIPLIPGINIEKIRKFKLLDGTEVYAKRIDPLRVRYPEEEIDVSNRVHAELQSIDLRFGAQRFIGIVYDKGIFYLLSLGVPAQGTVAQEDNSPEAKRLHSVLMRLGVTDPEGYVRGKDILISYAPEGQKQYTVIDFETTPYLNDELEEQDEMISADRARGAEPTDGGVSFAKEISETIEGEGDLSDKDIEEVIRNSAEVTDGEIQGILTQLNAQLAKTGKRQVALRMIDPARYNKVYFEINGKRKYGIGIPSEKEGFVDVYVTNTMLELFKQNAGMMDALLMHESFDDSKEVGAHAKAWQEVKKINSKGMMDLIMVMIDNLELDKIDALIKEYEDLGDAGRATKGWDKFEYEIYDYLIKELMKRLAGLLQIEPAEVSEILKTDNKILIQSLIKILKEDGVVTPEEIKVIVQQANLVEDVFAKVNIGEGSKVAKQIRDKVVFFLAIRALEKAYEVSGYPQFVITLQEKLKQKGVTKGIDGVFIENMITHLFKETDAFVEFENKFYSSKYFTSFVREMKEMLGVTEADVEINPLFEKLFEYKYIQVSVRKAFAVKKDDTPVPAGDVNEIINRYVHYRDESYKSNVANVLALHIIGEIGFKTRLGDKEELEKGKRFLEEVCNVEVPSLDDVRSLLKKHCMTTSQIKQALEISKIHYPGRKRNTVKLRFIGMKSPIVYWKKLDALELIKGEEIKFLRLKEEVSKYSDVSGINTIKELVNLLQAQWKSVRQLSKELNIPSTTIMGSIYFKGLPAVKVDFIGYRRQVYLPPGVADIGIIERLAGFERDIRRYEHIFGGIVSQGLMKMPIKLIRSRLTYLKTAFSKYIGQGILLLIRKGEFEKGAIDLEIKEWSGILKLYIAGHIAKDLFLESGEDVVSLIRKISELLEEIDKRIRINPDDAKDYLEIKDIFSEITRIYQGVLYVKGRLEKFSSPMGYQLFSIARIAEEGRVLLADDTRLGKTYEALMGSLFVNKGAGANKVLIICNKSAMSVWRDEIIKHLGGDTGFVIVSGPKKKERKKQLQKAISSDVKYVIVSFNTCARYIEKIKGLKADYVVVDEAHHIGKPTRRHISRDAIFQLQSRNRVLISATPLRNKHPDEVWSLLYWLFPEEVGTFTEFKREFGGKALSGFLKLKIFLWTKMVRFTRDEVEKDTARPKMITHQVPMSNLQAGLYRIVLEDFVSWYNKHFGGKVRKEAGLSPVVLSKLFRLREAACLSHLDEDTEIIIRSISYPYEIVEIAGKDIGREISLGHHKYKIGRHNREYFLENNKGKVILKEGEPLILEGNAYLVNRNELRYSSNKIDALLGLLIPAGKKDIYDPKKGNLLKLMEKEEKVVIFTESLKVLDAVRRLDPRIKCVHGDVSANIREQYIKEFNEGDGPQVLLATRATMGESIALHGATKVIEMDLPFTHRQRKQAIDRVLGREQRLKEVPVIYISSPDTIDDDLSRFLEAKKSIIDAFIDEEGMDIGRIVEDLLGKIRVFAKEKVVPEPEAIEPVEKKPELSRTDMDWEKVENVLGIKGIRFIQDPYKKLGKLLTREEVEELFNLYNNENNGAAFDTLLKFNINLVYAIVGSFIKKNPKIAIEKDDLIQEGMTGLMRGIELSDVNRGARLSTYAVWWIKQRCHRYLQNSSRVVRLPVHTLERLNKLISVETEYLIKNGEMPKSYSEIIEFKPSFELTERQYKKLFKIREQVYISIDVGIDDEGRALHDILGEEEGEMPLKRTELLNILDKTIAEFYKRITDKNKDRVVKIICLRIGYDFEAREIIDPVTLEDIGKIYGLTRERIRQIEKDWMPAFRKIFIKMGGTPDMLDLENVPSPKGPKSLGAAAAGFDGKDGNGYQMAETDSLTGNETIYDAEGRVLEVKDRYGNVIEKDIYDENGNHIEVELVNIKNGRDRIRLGVDIDRGDKDDFIKLEVLEINGEELKLVDKGLILFLLKKDGRINMEWFWPFRNKEFTGKGYGGTIFNWIAWYAKRHYKDRDDLTFNMTSTTNPFILNLCSKYISQSTAIGEDAGRKINIRPVSVTIEPDGAVLQYQEGRLIEKGYPDGRREVFKYDEGCKTIEERYNDFNKSVDSLYKKIDSKDRRETLQEGLASYAPENPQTLIIYTDSLLDNCGIIDMRESLKIKEIVENNILGRVIVFSEDKRNGIILERILKDISEKLDVVSVNKVKLGTPYEGKDDREIEALIKFLRDKMDIKTEDIIGIITGLTAGEEEIADVSELWKIPIVMFEKTDGPAVYSFVSAVCRAIEAKKEGKGWLIILPPIMAITEEILREYQEYKASLELLRAA